jgi:hypothetical protein
MVVKSSFDLPQLSVRLVEVVKILCWAGVPSSFLELFFDRFFIRGPFGAPLMIEFIVEIGVSIVGKLSEELLASNVDLPEQFPPRVEKSIFGKLIDF